MTVNMEPYYHWSSRRDWDNAPFDDCSPNLRAILGFCTKTFGGKTLGCHNDRDVDGNPLPPSPQTPKGTPSTHAWGAALDYLPDGGNLEGIRFVAPFLIQWSKELGINTIHDYVHQMMWKPGNVGWVPESIGSKGGQWLHIETTPVAWGDGRSVEERIQGDPNLPPPPEIPVAGQNGYLPAQHQYGKWPASQKPALGPGFGYTPGTQVYQGFCAYAWDVMKVEAGQGPVLDNGGTRVVWTIHSMAALMNLQQFFGLPVSGWMTKESWGVIDGLATNFGRPR